MFVQVRHKNIPTILKCTICFPKLLLYIWTFGGLLIQDSKDGLYPLDKLEATRKKMKCINELHVMDGGDHSFKIGKKFQESIGSNQDEAERKAVEEIAEFVSRSTKWWQSQMT